LGEAYAWVRRTRPRLLRVVERRVILVVVVVAELGRCGRSRESITTADTECGGPNVILGAWCNGYKEYLLRNVETE
jgi:hypothetical protein